MSDDFGQGLRILLVDDEPMVLDIFSSLFESAGFEVEAFDRLVIATEAFSTRPFDLVITDMKLPDGNGLTLAQRVEESPSDCEVVIITGFASIDSAIKAMNLRVADYFIKPMRGPQILERLRRLVEHLQLKRQHSQLQKEMNDKNKAVEILQAQATRDPLTGLFNHAYFQDQLANELSRCKRYHHKLGLLFIDVDNFKHINDTIGHQGGDLVLKAIADVLKGSCPDQATGFRLRDHDFAARYGGDEFVLILPETDKAGSSITAERLRGAVAGQRFDALAPINGALIKATLSIGVAAFPRDGSDRDSLIAAADTALYAAKKSGRNRVISYTDDLDPLGPLDNKKFLRRQEALEYTLAERALHFAYQPIIEPASNQIFGYEALCRPTSRDFRNPLDLIIAAERSGKIFELGRVLRNLAIAQIKQMPPACSLFINLHPLELHDSLLLEESSILAPWADKVVFEINNSRKIADQDRLRKVLIRLRERGYRVLLDDLCTGYLGLNSLMRLDPDFIKMGPSILSGDRSNGRESRIIRHYLDYTAGENITVIASGIETAREKQMAADLGCSLMQGHYFAKAGPEFVKIDK